MDLWFVMHPWMLKMHARFITAVLTMLNKLLVLNGLRCFLRNYAGTIEQN